MKFAIVISCSTGDPTKDNGRKPVACSFKTFRALARLQPPYTADRLVRLARAVEETIRSGNPERYRRARWLEEAVAPIARARPKHAASQQLQLCLTQLLSQSFHSIDWRRPLIRELNLPSDKARGRRTRRGS